MCIAPLPIRNDSGNGMQNTPFVANVGQHSTGIPCGVVFFKPHENIYLKFI